MTRAAAYSIGACTVTAIAVLYLFDPALSPWYPSCPLFAWTGWRCPGCGTLRAIHAVLHLRIVDALHYNALSVVCGAALAYATAFRRVAAAANRPVCWAIAACIFGVLRNIPLSPFIWLRP